ncbi:hypothetical protein BSKO_03868 [Bryopsis sp. KO-2023]|nr:hypothetical protein BSKO_03868 [Bryopsis sp. KO-2023]
MEEGGLVSSPASDVSINKWKEFNVELADQILELKKKLAQVSKRKSDAARVPGDPSYLQEKVVELKSRLRNCRIEREALKDKVTQLTMEVEKLKGGDAAVLDREAKALERVTLVESELQCANKEAAFKAEKLEAAIQQAMDYKELYKNATAEADESAEALRYMNDKCAGLQVSLGDAEIAMEKLKEEKLDVDTKLRFSENQFAGLRESFKALSAKEEYEGGDGEGMFDPGSPILSVVTPRGGPFSDTPRSSASPVTPEPAPPVRPIPSLKASEDIKGEVDSIVQSLDALVKHLKASDRVKKDVVEKLRGTEDMLRGLEMTQNSDVVMYEKEVMCGAELSPRNEAWDVRRDGVPGEALADVRRDVREVRSEIESSFISGVRGIAGIQEKLAPVTECIKKDQEEFSRAKQAAWDMGAQLATAIQDGDKARALVKKLDRELDGAKRTHKKEINTMQDKIRGLEENLAREASVLFVHALHWVGEKNAAVKRLEDLGISSEKMKKELDEKSGKCEELNDLVITASRSLRGDVLVIHQDVEDRRKERDMAVKRRVQSEERLRELEGEKMILEKDRKIGQGDLRRLREENDKAFHAVDELERKLMGMTEQVGVLEEGREEHAKDMEEAGREIERITGENDRLAVKLLAMEKEVEVVTEQLDLAVEEKVDVEFQLEALWEEYSYLNSSAENLARKVLEAEADSKDLAAANDGLIDQLDDERRTLDKVKAAIGRPSRNSGRSSGASSQKEGSSAGLEPLFEEEVLELGENVHGAPETDVVSVVEAMVKENRDLKGMVYSLGQEKGRLEKLQKPDPIIIYKEMGGPTSASPTEGPTEDARGLKMEAGFLKGELLNAEKSNQIVKEQLSEAKERVKELEDAVYNMDSEIEAAQEDLKSVAKDSLLRELADLKEANHNKNAENRELASQLNLATKKVHEFDKMFQSGSPGSGFLATQNVALQDQIERLRDAKEKLKGDLESTKGKCVELRNENKMLMMAVDAVAQRSDEAAKFVPQHVQQRELPPDIMKMIAKARKGSEDNEDEEGNRSGSGGGQDEAGGSDSRPGGSYSPSGNGNGTGSRSAGGGDEDGGDDPERWVGKPPEPEAATDLDEEGEEEEHGDPNELMSKMGSLWQGSSLQSRASPPAGRPRFGACKQYPNSMNAPSEDEYVEVVMVVKERGGSEAVHDIVVASRGTQTQAERLTGDDMSREMSRMWHGVSERSIEDREVKKMKDEFEKLKSRNIENIGKLRVLEFDNQKMKAELEAALVGNQYLEGEVRGKKDSNRLLLAQLDEAKKEIRRVAEHNENDEGGEVRTRGLPGFHGRRSLDPVEEREEEGKILTADLEKARAEIALLESRLADSKRSSDGDLESSRSDVKQLQQELEKTKADKNDLKQKLGRLDSELRKATEQARLLAVVQGEKNTLQKERDLEKKEKEALGVGYERASQVVKENEANQTKIEKEVNSLREENQKLISHRGTLNKQKAELERKLAEAQQYKMQANFLGNKLQVVNEEGKQKDVEMQKLKQELSKTAEEAEKLRNGAREWNEEREKLRGELHQAQEEQRVAKDRAVNIKEELERVKQERDTIKDDYELLEQTKKEMAGGQGAGTRQISMGTIEGMQKEKEVDEKMDTASSFTENKEGGAFPQPTPFGSVMQSYCIKPSISSDQESQKPDLNPFSGAEQSKQGGFAPTPGKILFGASSPTPDEGFRLEASSPTPVEPLFGQDASSPILSGGFSGQGASRVSKAFKPESSPPPAVHTSERSPSPSARICTPEREMEPRVSSPTPLRISSTEDFDTWNEEAKTPDQRTREATPEPHPQISARGSISPVVPAAVFTAPQIDEPISAEESLTDEKTEKDLIEDGDEDLPEKLVAGWSGKGADASNKGETEAKGEMMSKEEAEKLKKALKNAESQGVQNLGRMAMLQNENTKLAAKLKAAESRLKELEEAESNKIRSIGMVKLLENDRVKMRAEIESLRMELEYVVGEFENKKVRNRMLCGEVEEYKRQVEDLKNQVEMRERRIMELEEALGKMRYSFAGVEEDVGVGGQDEMSANVATRSLPMGLIVTPSKEAQEEVANEDRVELGLKDEYGDEETKVATRGLPSVSTQDDDLKASVSTPCGAPPTFGAKGRKVPDLEAEAAVLSDIQTRSLPAYLMPDMQKTRHHAPSSVSSSRLRSPVRDPVSKMYLQWSNTHVIPSGGWPDGLEGELYESDNTEEGEAAPRSSIKDPTGGLNEQEAPHIEPKVVNNDGWGKWRYPDVNINEQSQDSSITYGVPPNTEDSESRPYYLGGGPSIGPLPDATKTATRGIKIPGEITDLDEGKSGQILYRAEPGDASAIDSGEPQLPVSHSPHPEACYHQAEVLPKHDGSDMEVETGGSAGSRRSAQVRSIEDVNSDEVNIVREGGIDDGLAEHMERSWLVGLGLRKGGIENGEDRKGGDNIVEAGAVQEAPPTLSGAESEERIDVGKPPSMGHSPIETPRNVRDSSTERTSRSDKSPATPRVVKTREVAAPLPVPLHMSLDPAIDNPLEDIAASLPSGRQSGRSSGRSHTRSVSSEVELLPVRSSLKESQSLGDHPHQSPSVEEENDSEVPERPFSPSARQWNPASFLYPMWHFWSSLSSVGHNGGQSRVCNLHSQASGDNQPSPVIHPEQVQSEDIPQGMPPTTKVEQDQQLDRISGGLGDESDPPSLAIQTRGLKLPFTREADTAPNSSSGVQKSDEVCGGQGDKEHGDGLEMPGKSNANLMDDATYDSIEVDMDRFWFGGPGPHEAEQHHKEALVPRTGSPVSREAIEEKETIQCEEDTSVEAQQEPIEVDAMGTAASFDQPIEGGVDAQASDPGQDNQQDNDKAQIESCYNGWTGWSVLPALNDDIQGEVLAEGGAATEQEEEIGTAGCSEADVDHGKTSVMKEEGVSVAREEEEEEVAVEEASVAREKKDEEVVVAPLLYGGVAELDEVLFNADDLGEDLVPNCVGIESCPPHPDSIEVVPTMTDSMADSETDSVDFASFRGEAQSVVERILADDNGGERPTQAAAGGEDLGGESMSLLPEDIEDKGPHSFLEDEMLNSDRQDETQESGEMPDAEKISSRSVLSGFFYPGSAQVMPNQPIELECSSEMGDVGPSQENAPDSGENLSRAGFGSISFTDSMKDRFVKDSLDDKHNEEGDARERERMGLNLFSEGHMSAKMEDALPPVSEGQDSNFQECESEKTEYQDSSRGWWAPPVFSAFADHTSEAPSKHTPPGSSALEEQTCEPEKTGGQDLGWSWPFKVQDSSEALSEPTPPGSSALEDQTKDATPRPLVFTFGAPPDESTGDHAQSSTLVAVDDAPEENPFQSVRDDAVDFEDAPRFGLGYQPGGTSVQPQEYDTDVRSLDDPGTVMETAGVHSKSEVGKTKSEDGNDQDFGPVPTVVATREVTPEFFQTLNDNDSECGDDMDIDLEEEEEEKEEGGPSVFPDNEGDAGEAEPRETGTSVDLFRPELAQDISGGLEDEIKKTDTGMNTAMPAFVPGVSNQKPPGMDLSCDETTVDMPIIVPAPPPSDNSQEALMRSPPVPPQRLHEEGTTEKGSAEYEPGREVSRDQVNTETESEQQSPDVYIQNNDGDEEEQHAAVGPIIRSRGLPPGMLFGREGQPSREVAEVPSDLRPALQDANNQNAVLQEEVRSVRQELECSQKLMSDVLREREVLKQRIEEGQIELNGKTQQLQRVVEERGQKAGELEDALNEGKVALKALDEAQRDKEELERSLAQILKHNEDLKAMLSEKDTDIDNVKEQRGSVAKELQDAKERGVKLEREVQALTLEKEKRDVELAEKESAVQSSNARYEELAEELENAEKQESDLTKQVEGLAVEIEDLREAMSLRDSQFQNALEERGMVAKQLDESKKHEQDLMQQVNTMTAAHESTKAELNSAVKEAEEGTKKVFEELVIARELELKLLNEVEISTREADQLRSGLVDKEKEAQEAAEAHQAVLKELEGATARERELKTQVALLVQETDSLKVRLSQRDKESQELEAQRDKLTKELSDIREREEQLASRVDSLAKDSNDARVLLANRERDLAGEIADIKTKHNSALAELEDAKKRNAHLEGLLVEGERVRREMSDRLEMQRLDLAAASDAADTMTQDLDETRKQVRELTAASCDLDEEEDLMADLQVRSRGLPSSLGSTTDQQDAGCPQCPVYLAQLEDVRDERDQLKALVAVLSSEKEKLKGTVNELRQQLAESQGDREEDREALRKALGNEAELKISFAEAQSEKDKMAGKLKALQAEFASRMQEMSRALNSAQADNQAAVSALKLKEEECQTLLDSMEKGSDERAKLEMVVADLSSEKDDLRTQLISAQNRAHTTSEDFSDSLKLERSEKNAATAILTALRSDCDMFAGKVAKLTREKQVVEQGSVALQERYENLLSRNVDLEKEVQDARAGGSGVGGLNQDEVGASLKMELVEALSEQEKMRGALQQRDEEIQRLKTEIENLTSVSSGLKEEVKSTQSRNTELQQEMERMERMLGFVEATSASQDNARGFDDNLRGHAPKDDDTISDAQGSVRSRTVDFDLLNPFYDTSGGRARSDSSVAQSAANLEKDELVARLVAAEKAAASAKATLNRSRRTNVKKLKEVMSDAEKSEEEIKRLKTALATLEGEAEAKVSKLKIHSERLQVQLEALQAVKSIQTDGQPGIDEMVEKTMAEMQKLLAVNRELKEENDKAEVELAEARESLEAERNERKEAMEGLEEKMRVAEMEVESLSNSLGEVVQTTMSLGSELETAHAERDAQTNRLLAVSDEKQSILRELQQFKNALNEVRTQGNRGTPSAGKSREVQTTNVGACSSTSGHGNLKESIDEMALEVEKLGVVFHSLKPKRKVKLMLPDMKGLETVMEESSGGTEESAVNSGQSSESFENVEVDVDVDVPPGEFGLGEAKGKKGRKKKKSSKKGDGRKGGSLLPRPPRPEKCDKGVMVDTDQRREPEDGGGPSEIGWNEWECRSLDLALLSLDSVGVRSSRKNFLRRPGLNSVGAPEESSVWGRLVENDHYNGVEVIRRFLALSMGCTLGLAVTVLAGSVAKGWKRG